MRYRGIAAVVAGVLALAAGCKGDEVKPAEPTEQPRLPPVGATPGKDAAAGSGSGAMLPPVGSGGGGASGAGSGSGSGSAIAAGSGSGSGSSSGSGSAVATGSGSGFDTSGSAKPISANPTTDCDVSVSLSEQSADWSGGATGSVAMEKGHFPGNRLTDALAPLDDGTCRIVISPAEGVRYDAVITALEAVNRERNFKLSIATTGGTRLLATPPSTGAAGTAVRDAKLIVIGKKEIRIGDLVAASVDDADIATKVATALTAAQAGSRGIMVIVKAEQATPYKVVSAALAGAKTVGFDSVIFAGG
jgi:biopolymer transport protein ExbD